MRPHQRVLDFQPVLTKGDRLIHGRPSISFPIPSAYINLLARTIKDHAARAPPRMMA